MPSEVKWIKIAVDMFDDEKIDFISSLPESDGIILIWIRLLTLAGKCNAGGFIMLTENIPYTDEMIAHKFRKPIALIRLALETFSRMGMIQQDPDGRLYITNWAKHQNIDGMDKIREQTRKRVSEFRERQKAIPDVTQGNVTGNGNVTHSSISISNSISEDISNKQEEGKKKKQEKHKYGPQSNVLLTDDEKSRLEAEYGADFIARVIEFYSSYKVEKNYKSGSDNLSIRRWVINAVKERDGGGGKAPPLKVHTRTAMLDMPEA